MSASSGLQTCAPERKVEKKPRCGCSIGKEPQGSTQTTVLRVTTAGILNQEEEGNDHH